MYRGRRYRAEIETTYLGGTLPADAYAALATTLRHSFDGQDADVSLRVARHPHDVAVAGVTVYAGSPLDAIGELHRAWHGVLRRTGLFEEFDVSGEVLRVAPVEQRAHPHEPPSSEDRH